MDEMREDEFLWWQRRAMIVLCGGVFLYGLFAEPMLLIMTPLLMLVVAFAISRILRDRTQRDRSSIPIDGGG